MRIATIVTRQGQNLFSHLHHILHAGIDISSITPEELTRDYPVLLNNGDLLLVGCAPCQPFSKQRRSDHEHISTNLLDDFGRFVRALEPVCVLIENVPGIQNRGHVVFERFLTLLDEMHYHTFYTVVNAQNYGVPQKRKRLVLIAAQDFFPDEPPVTHGGGLLPYMTVRDAIERFPAIEAGGTNEAFLNHSASSLSDIIWQCELKGSAFESRMDALIKQITDNHYMV